MSYVTLQTMILDFLYITKDFAQGFLDFLFTPQDFGAIGTITPIFPLFSTFATVIVVRVIVNVIFG